MCAAAHLHPFCLLGSQRTCMICIQRLPKSSQMGFFGVMNWQGYQYLCMVSHRKVTMVTYNTARHADRGQIGNLKQFAKLPPPDPPTMVVVVVVYQTRFQSRAPRQFGIAKICLHFYTRPIICSPTAHYNVLALAIHPKCEVSLTSCWSRTIAGAAPRKNLANHISKSLHSCK